MLYTESQREEHIEEILTLLYQIALRDSRIPIVLPSKVFNDDAALAVRAYQEAYDLPVTGEIDGATWDSIVDTYHRLMDTAEPIALFPSGEFLLKEGDGGELVTLVQVLYNLAARRYQNLLPVEVTGQYDSATADAVRRLQQLSSLPETGSMDRSTWNRLAALVNRMPLEL